MDRGTGMAPSIRPGHTERIPGGDGENAKFLQGELDQIVHSLGQARVLLRDGKFENVQMGFTLLTWIQNYVRDLSADLGHKL